VSTESEVRWGLLPLPPHALASIPAGPDLLTAEIAGRDSAAAVIALLAAEPDRFTHLLPTIVHTPTEFGDTTAPDRTVAWLATQLGDRVETLPPIHLFEPVLWSALNGRFATELAARYGACSACLACHLYVHLCRVPLLWNLAGGPLQPLPGDRLAPVLVTGERDSHDGSIKLSQTPAQIDASVELLAYAGIDLREPIRAVDATSEIKALVGSDWPAADGDLQCVHSGNFRSLDGEVSFDMERHRAYLAEFYIPAAKAVIDAWREQPGGPATLDYVEIARTVLQG
jgi:hypothetical protein